MHMPIVHARLRLFFGICRFSPGQVAGTATKPSRSDLVPCPTLIRPSTRPSAFASVRRRRPWVPELRFAPRLHSYCMLPALRHRPKERSRAILNTGLCGALPSRLPYPSRLLHSMQSLRHLRRSHDAIYPLGGSFLLLRRQCVMCYVLLLLEGVLAAPGFSVVAPTIEASCTQRTVYLYTSFCGTRSCLALVAC
jgi:hypothetical protein